MTMPSAMARRRATPRPTDDRRNPEGMDKEWKEGTDGMEWIDQWWRVEWNGRNGRMEWKE